MPRSFLLTVGLLLWPCLLGPPLRAEEVDPETSQEEIIQRILDLRQQVEDLLEILPEDLRQEVERRWQEDQARKPEEAVIGSPPGPETETDSTSEAQPPAEPAIETEPRPASEPAAIQEVPTDEQVATPAVPPCGGFPLFDTNEDSVVSAGDRPWRYLRLWFDTNGNSSLEEDEIEGLFELGVRQIDVALRFYIDDEDNSEDVDVDDLIWLRQVGKARVNRRSGALVVDVDRLGRAGRFWLTDEDGVQLTGHQPLGSDAFLHTGDGDRLPVLCKKFVGNDLN